VVILDQFGKTHIVLERASIINHYSMYSADHILAGMANASHRRHFAIIVTQAKWDTIMIWTNGFDVFAIIEFFDAISQFVCDYFLRFSIFSINF